MEIQRTKLLSKEGKKKIQLTKTQRTNPNPVPHKKRPPFVHDAHAHATPAGEFSLLVYKIYIITFTNYISPHPNRGKRKLGKRRKATAESEKK